MDSTRTLRILCVDDNPDIRLIVELSLNLDPHFAAVSVGGAAEAMSALSEQTFDLVLLDALVEEASGLKLLENITKTDGSPPTPVIFLTADTIRRSRYDKPGVLGVITKPFDPITLAAVVRSHIADIDKERLSEK
ncbi:response regulator [Sphingomonas sp. PAMC 26621]|uniref:response regulator n=1 Tax=Sphingomonas sp. PAMC 26621 TaxID=1112213 RepID=UPI000287B31A|nr:response regulator [Sphingomonas sp. PAMC 26621]